MVSTLGAQGELAALPQRGPPRDKEATGKGAGKGQRERERKDYAPPTTDSWIRHCVD